MQGYQLKPSPIHGQGVFTTKKFQAKENIDLGIVFIFWTFPIVTSHFGRWLNHSYQPNGELAWQDGKWYIRAIEDIEPDEEITINYDCTPWYIKKPDFQVLNKN